MAITKRQKKQADKVESGKHYSSEKAMTLLKEFASEKFDESIDASVNLGIDPRKSDQVVRGSTVLPNGSGKKITVAVFTGPKAEEAKEAGAEYVGLDDLAEQFKKNEVTCDVVIASPDAMAVVGKLGQILGPKGLMPNPKVGTVTPDIAGAVKNAKAGQVRYRNDKAGIIHCTIGRASFEPAKLIQNLEALLADLKKAKPSSAKGIYLQKVSVSSTMGPGLTIDQSSLKV